MHYDLAAPSLPHNPLKAIVAPRPIGWISAMSREGALNLAPYSFFNAVADDMAEPIVDALEMVDVADRDHDRAVRRQRGERLVEGVIDADGHVAQLFTDQLHRRRSVAAAARGRRPSPGRAPSVRPSAERSQLAASSARSPSRGRRPAPPAPTTRRATR